MDENNDTLLLRTDEQKNKDHKGKKTFIRSDDGKFSNETIMMNVNTFKKLCLKANTESSDKIHDYYIKLEMMFNDLMKEELDQHKKEIKEKELEKKRLLEDSNKTILQLKKEKELERHNILLKEFGTVGCIVYIVCVKLYENGEYVIKIGESRRGIASRYLEHKQRYEEAIILDCFKVYRSKDFEHFLHNHKDISGSRVMNLPNHENERELFLIGKELSYTQLLNIINTHIHIYNDQSQLEHQLKQSKLEIEKLRLLNNMGISDSEHIISMLVHNNKILLDELNNVKNFVKEEINGLKNELQMQKTTTNNFGEQLNTLGPYVQQLNPENLSLIKVFDSVAEVCAIFKTPRSSITKAYKENTIYKNFRWNLVDRAKDPYIVEIANIQPTRRLSKIQNLGYIAKLNHDKSEILNVYLDRKTASIKNGYASVSYLDYFVKHCKPVNNYYYVLYETLDDNIKNRFLNKIKSDNIVLYKKNGIGQFSINGDLLKEFRSKHECQTLLKIGNKSLCKALETGKAFNNNIYKYLQDKVCIGI